MALRVDVLCWLPVVLVTVAAPARGEQPSSPVKVWYRSSEGCPEGAAFLRRLERRGLNADLAGVGDPVDFVVSLEQKDGSASGRLERQTSQGTVAIRDISSDNCDEVADALALTLELSVSPKSAPEPEKPVTARSGPPRAEHVRPRLLPPPPIRPGHPVADKGAFPSGRAESSTWELGVLGTATAGVAPGLAPGVGLFVERDFGGAGAFAPALRGSIAGSQSSTVSPRGELRVRWYAAALDVCPIVLVAGSVVARPCAGIEAGVYQADEAGPTGTRAATGWVGASAPLRLAWRSTERFSLELSGGPVLPLTRPEIRFANPDEQVYRVAAVGFRGQFGAAVRWP